MPHKKAKSNQIGKIIGDRMFGLPVEMITMLGSSVLGGVMTVWG